jgi:hypothetical protein
MDRPRSLKDILSGLIFIGFGVAFGVAAAGYPIGTALRMGPGYFPLVLAVALGLIGLLIVGKGFSAAAADSDLGRVPWRAMLQICGAIIFFGATVRGLGLAPTLLVTVSLAALASRHTRLPGALVLAAGMTLLCLLVFTVGLGLALPVVGPWLR